MFYNLLLAHLLADFPLQSNWMVANKARWQVLGLHTGIHFLASLVLLWPVMRIAWPYILMLAALHFLLDLAKNALNQARPNWVSLPYLADQGCHLISIFVIAGLIEQKAGTGAMPAQPVWVILLIAYLLVTFVWHITERVLVGRDSGYRKVIRDGYWVRMGLRASLLTLILIAWMWLFNPALARAATFLVPYRSRLYGRRAIFIDIVVPAVVALLVMIAL